MLRANSSLETTSYEALGQSEAFLDFQEHLARVAPIDRPVLLLGERGTGKELAATRLHFLSHRWQGPLITLNCASLTPSLVEAELFGHERGAFTGADNRRTGRFEAANNGTLFLDEIGAIPMEIQEKILRVVEYGRFERVGSSSPIEVNARIISATNVDLTARCKNGRFMPDLLDRLSFEVLFLPPCATESGTSPFLPITLHGKWPGSLAEQNLPDSRLKLQPFWRLIPGGGISGNLKTLLNGRFTVQAIIPSEMSFSTPFPHPMAICRTGPIPTKREKRMFQPQKIFFPISRSCPLNQPYRLWRSSFKKGTFHVQTQPETGGNPVRSIL